MPIKLERGSIPKPKITDEFEAFEGFIHGVDIILKDYPSAPKEIQEAITVRHHFQKVTQNPKTEQSK